MSSKHMYTTANLSDSELKEQGNRLFSTRKYDDAIQCYTKAIIKNPQNATYFTNRALCYLKLKKWDLSCQDCKRALDMDKNLVKGHFFLGQCLMELVLYDEAIKHLQRAHDLAREQKRNFGDDIASQLRLARKKRWNVQEEKRICQEIELHSYLKELIEKDVASRLDALKVFEETDKEEPVTMTTEESKDINKEQQQQKPAGEEDELEQKRREIESEGDNHMTELNNLFAKVDDRRRKREVPDYLCGKISFEILQDPVITPSGITYERKDIEEHLQRVGHFDPVTRVKLSVDQLIPNFSMKEVVDTFVAENEWSLEY